MDNKKYGGFLVSKNVLLGAAIRYTYREKSDVPELNGWTVYSINDDDEYVNDSSNFEIIGMSTLVQFAPVFLEIFSAPYGTDLCWLYKKGVHVGFYDLTSDSEVSIKEMLKK